MSSELQDTDEPDLIEILAKLYAIMILRTGLHLFNAEKEQWEKAQQEGQHKPKDSKEDKSYI